MEMEKIPTSERVALGKAKNHKRGEEKPRCPPAYEMLNIGNGVLKFCLLYCLILLFLIGLSLSRDCISQVDRST